MFREAEHAQRFLVADAGRDGGATGLFEVRDGDGEFFVEGHDFYAAGGRDRNGGMEEVESESFGGDVEVVKVPEVIRGTLAYTHEHVEVTARGVGTTGGLI